MEDKKIIEDDDNWMRDLIKKQGNIIPCCDIVEELDRFCKRCKDQKPTTEEERNSQGQIPMEDIQPTKKNVKGDIIFLVIAVILLLFSCFCAFIVVACIGTPN